MGDYADDALFAGLDEDWEDYREPFWNRIPKRLPRKCKYCGLYPLYWNQVNGQWRLHTIVDGKDVLHDCRKDNAPQELTGPPIDIPD